MKQRKIGNGKKPVIGAISFTIVVLCMSALQMAQPASAGEPNPSFTCQVREATITPPKPAPPTFESLATAAADHSPEPIHPASLCPEGQVPVTTRIDTRYFHKGNPRLRAYPASGPEHALEPGFVNGHLLLSFDQLYGGDRENPARPDFLPESTPPASTCDGIAYYGSCYYYASAAQSVTSDGGGMTFGIERPLTLEGTGGGHSIDEISVEASGGNLTDAEMGWNISASQYGDVDPHLFVYHWVNGAETCYDTCAWNQYSSTYYPGMSLAPLAGKPVYMGWVHANGAWWAWFNDQWLGYIKDSEWSGAFTQAGLIQWFGEVASGNGIPPRSQMGNGEFPRNGPSAVMSTLCAADAAKWVCSYGDQQSTSATQAAFYDIVNHSSYGATRYGGPGQTATVVPELAVTPSVIHLVVTTPFTVSVAVSDDQGDPSPTGTVRLTCGGYSSPAATLESGAAQIAVPAGMLTPGTDKLLVEFTPDTRSAPTFSSASGSATVVVASAKITPNLVLTPSATLITTLQPLTVHVVVSAAAGKPKPTGSVKLTGGGYTSKAITLTAGSATINVPAKSLLAAADNLMVVYTPDAAGAAVYNSASASRTITVKKAAQSIAWTTALPVTIKLGVSITLTAKASSGLAVTFSVTGPAKLNGAELSFTGAGNVIVTAKQSGNSIFSPAENLSHEIVVTKK